MFHHYIITRFSILDTKSKSFRLTRNRSNSIKNALFNTERLNNKFTFFDKITYPSVINQSYKHFTWLIYTSPHLPDIYKKKLKTYEGPHIKIIYVNNLKEMHADINTQINADSFSTLRLDDDDGINVRFLEMLNKYESEKGAIISAPRGRWYRIHNGELQSRKSFNHKNTAIGLTAIGFNIFTAGNHMKINEKYRVIYDNMPNAVIQSCSNVSDTGKIC